MKPTYRFVFCGGKIRTEKEAKRYFKKEHKGKKLKTLYKG